MVPGMQAKWGMEYETHRQIWIPIEYRKQTIRLQMDIRRGTVSFIAASVEICRAADSIAGCKSWSKSSRKGILVNWEFDSQIMGIEEAENIYHSVPKRWFVLCSCKMLSKIHDLGQRSAAPRCRIGCTRLSSMLCETRWCTVPNRTPYRRLVWAAHIAKSIYSHCTRHTSPFCQRGILRPNCCSAHSTLPTTLAMLPSSTGGPVRAAFHYLIRLHHLTIDFFRQLAPLHWHLSAVLPLKWLWRRHSHPVCYCQPPR